MSFLFFGPCPTDVYTRKQVVGSFTIISVQAGIKIAMEHGHTKLMIVQRNTIKRFKTHADLTSCLKVCHPRCVKSVTQCI
jgi:hypothetical protein